MSDLYDAKQDAKSESRYDEGMVDPEPDHRADLEHWNGAFVCVVDESARTTR